MRARGPNPRRCAFPPVPRGVADRLNLTHVAPRCPTLPRAAVANPQGRDQSAGAATALTSAGVPTYGHVMKGMGHGIAPDGLSVALAFLRDRLGYA